MRDLISRSSTFSSSELPARAPLGAAVLSDGLLGRERARAAVWTKRARRLPCGAVFACLFIAAVHACLVLVVYPHPVARPRLRYKVMAMTATDRPVLVVAGDSRAQRHLIPSVLADRIGIDESKVVNIAVAAGDSSSVLAAYHEFSERFERQPVFVISISSFCVGARGEYEPAANGEYYWSIGPADRFRTMSAKEAVQSTFAPERLLIRQIRDYLNRDNLGYIWGDRGYRVLDGVPWEGASRGFPRTIGRLARRGWFKLSEPGALPWKQLRADLRSLHDAGVQLVVLDAPEHPAFLDALADTPQGNAYARFRRLLATLCQVESIPLLRYTAQDLGPGNPDDLFWDGVHLNRLGAQALSELVGRDLQKLIERDMLHLPSTS